MSDSNRFPPDQPSNPPTPPSSYGSFGGPQASGEGAFAPQPRFVIPLAQPTVTRVLLVLNVIVFVAMIVYGYFEYGTINGTQDMRVLTDMGAKVNDAIAVDGEIWRLFTAMFLHIGVIHLLFNLYALNALGPLVEGYFGHMRFLAIYLLGGLFGSLASYAFSPVASAGASGAIFGLAGATTVYFMRYRENFGNRGRAILQNMLIVIGLNLVFGLSMPGIDNWGHIGGLIGGAVVAAGLLPRYRPPQAYSFGTNALEEESRRALEAGWVLICASLLGIGLEFATRAYLG